MFGKKEPRGENDDYSLASINDSEKDELFARYRNRNKIAHEKAQRERIDSYADLDPETRAHRIEFDRRMQDMLGDYAAPRSSSTARRVFARPEERRWEQGGANGKVGLSIAAVALGAAAIFLPGAITDANYGSEKAASFLEEVGYTNVELEQTQTVLFLSGCGKGDSVKYTFEATGQDGLDTTVMVCKGMFRGATIRHW